MFWTISLEKKRKRKLWENPWLQRSKLGVLNTLLLEIKLEDQKGSKNYLRMTEENFFRTFDHC